MQTTIDRAWAYGERVFARAGEQLYVHRHRFDSRERAEAFAPRVDARRTIDPTYWKDLTTDLDISPLYKGRHNAYAVPGGDTRLKIRVELLGRTYVVKDAAYYGQGRTYGTQVEGKRYKGLIADKLRAILADPEAAAVAYGRLVKRCSVCGRKLEDPESVARGIGPVCAGRFA